MKKEDSIIAKGRWPASGASDRRRKPLIPTKENPLIISASELRDFLTCRVKWNWRYNRLIVPKETSPALTMGSLGHQLAASWYDLPASKRTVKAMEKIAKKMLKGTRPRELSKADFDTLYAMSVGYAAWARPRDRELGIRTVKTEQWFELPLTDDGLIIVRGFIDGVFKLHSLKRTMGCFEHKFKSQIRMGTLDINLQLSVYLWALRRLYPKFKRYIGYFQILKKKIPGPRSKADLFAREPIERMDEEIDQWALDTERACLDMLDAAIYPNPSDSCSWMCDYETPCLLRGRPEDLEHIFKTQYKKKPKKKKGKK